jgi:hypothetical protein
MFTRRHLLSQSVGAGQIVLRMCHTCGGQGRHKGRKSQPAILGTYNNDTVKQAVYVPCTTAQNVSPLPLSCVDAIMLFIIRHVWN